MIVVRQVGMSSTDVQFTIDLGGIFPMKMQRMTVLAAMATAGMMMMGSAHAGATRNNFV